MIGRSSAKRFLVLGSVLAGLGVAAGAFGAHALKDILDAPMLQVFETATRYVMYHAFGLCIVSWAIDRYPEQRLEKSGWLFLLGILLFSQFVRGVPCGYPVGGGHHSDRWASFYDGLGTLRLGSLARFASSLNKPHFLAVKVAKMEPVRAHSRPFFFR